jgi:hypothetical protein
MIEGLPGAGFIIIVFILILLKKENSVFRFTEKSGRGYLFNSFPFSKREVLFRIL